MTGWIMTAENAAVLTANLFVYWRLRRRDRAVKVTIEDSRVHVEGPTGMTVDEV